MNGKDMEQMTLLKSMPEIETTEALKVINTDE